MVALARDRRGTSLWVDVPTGQVWATLLAMYATQESDEDVERSLRFWRTLRRKIEHGPKVRVPEGYDRRGDARNKRRS